MIMYMYMYMYIYIYMYVYIYVWYKTNNHWVSTCSPQQNWISSSQEGAMGWIYQKYGVNQQLLCVNHPKVGSNRQKLMKKNMTNQPAIDTELALNHDRLRLKLGFN